MIKKFIDSILYRYQSINKKSISGNRFSFKNHGKLIGCKLIVNGDDNSISIGLGTIIRNTTITINGNSCQLNIGEDIAMKSGELWLEGNFCKLTISKNTSIEEAHIAVTEDDSEIFIGEDCMFAKGIEIRNGDSHAIFNFQNERINHAKNIFIGNHVWLGSRSIVLKGAYIGNGSIIGASAVITKAFGENELVAGNPGKTIREKIFWTRAR